MADRSETLISGREVIKLYDAQDNEIGMTVGGSKEIAYAMAHSTRISKAVAHNPMFGEEVIMRKDICMHLDKVMNNHRLGDNLLFWAGAPLVVNK